MILGFFLLFLLFGSVLNVIIYRLPLMLQQRWQQECADFLQTPSPLVPKPVNLFFPRSFCRHCKHTIPAWHNIPLISYVLLRGKCHQCQHPISFDYPLVECLFASLATVATLHFGVNTQGFAAIVFIATTICLTWIDKNQQLLPDELTLSLLWIGLLTNINAYFVPLNDAVIGAVCGYLSLWLVMQLYRLLTGKIGMGHGDFKLFAALGAWFGWAWLPLILLCAATAGAIFGIYSIYYQGKSTQTPIPFGPFLCLSGMIVLLYPVGMLP
jgi:leader peptidase (prepilin peptidase)/N-methyltransferase